MEKGRLDRKEKILAETDPSGRWVEKRLHFQIKFVRRGIIKK